MDHQPQTLRIGNLILTKPFFQAPLSGYTDYAMRKLARCFGAPLTFAGVMLAKSAAHPKILTKPQFRPSEDEHPIGAQILGTRPEVMAKAAKDLTCAGYDIIDLNFACPAPKVLRRGRGGHLLKKPELVREIHRRVKEAVDCPVTMKLRIGYDNSQQSVDNFRQICSDAAADNVDALIIHGRTVKQKFRYSANWSILAELKKQMPHITIIGSGDIFEAQKSIERMKTAGIDGILIARGAIGNPWLFRDLDALFQNKPIPPLPTLKEQAEVILNHFEMLCPLYKGQKAVRFFRKFLANYCRLHPHRKKAQESLLAAKDKAQLLDAIKLHYGLT